MVGYTPCPYHGLWSAGVISSIRYRSIRQLVNLPSPSLPFPPPPPPPRPKRMIVPLTIVAGGKLVLILMSGAGFLSYPFSSHLPLITRRIYARIVLGGKLQIVITSQSDQQPQRQPRKFNSPPVQAKKKRSGMTKSRIVKIRS